jgi:hypothetical protein
VPPLEPTLRRLPTPTTVRVSTILLILHEAQICPILQQISQCVFGEAASRLAIIKLVLVKYLTKGRKTKQSTLFVTTLSLPANLTASVSEVCLSALVHSKAHRIPRQMFA